MVGDEIRPLPGGENAPLLDVLTGPGANTGRPRGPPWGDWKGFAPDGTLSLLPGVRAPAEYMLCDLECDMFGEARSGFQRGLVWPVEKVADVGVPYSGDGGP
jgi:hypothetical protein